MRDVLLNRVFSSVHYAFYIDIGAYHPIDDSVTKSFYDRGWHGINIESGEIFDTLATARPRDINLNMAVYDHAGTISFVQHPGWYAGLSHVQADAAALTDASSSQSAVEIRKVACDTLANILDRYGGQRPIAFLKIDAEGAEEAIIRSTDWRAIRPTVIVIEATKPRSTVLDNQRWEPILLEQGYLRAYFDGINCYYVPKEQADLLRHFELPVNVLDGYRRFDAQHEATHAEAQAATARLNELAAELARTSAQHEQSGGQLKQQLEHNTALQRELQNTQNKFEAARRQLESLPAAQNAAIAAVVQANAYQLADLRRQLADLDAQCVHARQERDALLNMHAQAAQLRRLLRELQWPDGPAALRAVLPLARLLRRFAGTKAPPVSSEELALFAPAPAGASVVSPVAAPPPPAARRSIAKRAVWFAYRPFRRVGRPPALRLRAFLTTPLHAAFHQLDDKLNLLREDLTRLSASQPVAVATAHIPG